MQNITIKIICYNSSSILRDLLGSLSKAAKVEHKGGHGAGDRIASGSIKIFHMGQSRIYAMCKLNHQMPFMGSLGRALLQLLHLNTWLSRRKLTKKVHFLRGVLSAT
jgi:hypothetical protein